MVEEATGNETENAPVNNSIVDCTYRDYIPHADCTKVSITDKHLQLFFECRMSSFSVLSMCTRQTCGVSV